MRLIKQATCSFPVGDLPAHSKPFLDAFCTKAMHAARHQPCILDDTCTMYHCCSGNGCTQSVQQLTSDIKWHDCSHVYSGTLNGLCW